MEAEEAEEAEENPLNPLNLLNLLLLLINLDLITSMPQPTILLLLPSKCLL